MGGVLTASAAEFILLELVGGAGFVFRGAVVETSTSVANELDDRTHGLESSVRKKSQLAGALYGAGQGTLLFSVEARYARGHDFATGRRELREHLYVFIVEHHVFRGTRATLEKTLF